MPEEVDVQPESSPGEGVPASPPESADPLQNAIDKGDYATYERLSNARDIGKGEPEKIAAPQKGEPAPASQPVKPQEPPKPQGRPPKPNARADRIQELLAQNNELRKQLEGAASGVTPASPPAPAPTPPPPPAVVAPKPETPKDDPEPVLEKKPDGSRWKDYDEYREAWKGWAFREGGRQREAAITQEQQKAAETRVQTLWKSRWEATAQDPEYPDYAKVAFNKDVFINKVTEGFLYTSEQGPKILYHLGKNPEIAAKLAQQDAYNTMRFLVQLEHSIVPKPEPPKPDVPAPTKQTTRMKPPASELSGRNTAPADELEAAVARGDYRAYERLANRQDLDSIRGR